MLRCVISRFTLKLVVFLVLIFTTSCLTLRTIPTNDINQLQPVRKIIKIHAQDSLWVIDQYQIKDKVLSGRIIRKQEGITRLNSADIYVAPLIAIRINGDILAVPIVSIGKVDYQVPDALIIISSISIGIVVLFFSLVFSN